MLGVRHRLTGEARLELTKDEIGQKSKHDQTDKAAQKVCLPEQDRVTNSPHGAEPAALGQETDAEPHDERQ